MGILRDAGGADGQEPIATSALHSSFTAPASASGGGAPDGDGARPLSTHTDARSDLRRRRDELAEQVTELHWDLGGLAYEMAIRDHFRLDVLVRRAAILQERDAELAEVERLLRMEDDAVAGTCPHCAAPHSRGALFCWQCGATLMERTPSAAIVADTTDASTAVMDALLAGDSAQGGGDSASSLGE
jgi:hypothetical protein